MNVDKNKMKYDAVIDPDSLMPVTEEQIRLRDLREMRAEEIGMSLTTYDGGEDDISSYDNPYALEALGYIMLDEEVPEELKNKIKQFETSDI